MVIKDRLLDERMDGPCMFVIIPDADTATMIETALTPVCPVCGDRADVHQVQTSYAFKLLLDEMKSLGVAMRMELEDQR